mmetsp:Transcript_30107/g.88066  ORF Transcript_30107/g.88066 Transcript_30107/m.88066 type:complete len:102 (+) Transcript_30107:666-971(+)
MSTSPCRKRRKVAADASVSTVPVAGSGRPTTGQVGQVKEPPESATSSTSDSGTPTLPAVVWGRVLDFLAYGDARQAILVNKFMANEAPKYVQDIYITEPLT